MPSAEGAAGRWGAEVREGLGNHFVVSAACVKEAVRVPRSPTMPHCNGRQVLPKAERCKGSHHRLRALHGDPPLGCHRIGWVTCPRNRLHRSGDNPFLRQMLNKGLIQDVVDIVPSNSPSPSGQGVCIHVCIYLCNAVHLRTAEGTLL